MNSFPAAHPLMRPSFALRVAIIGVMAWMRFGVYGHRPMPIAFGMPLVLFIWMKDRRLLWITVGAFAATTLLKFLVVLPILNVRGQPEDLAARVGSMSLVLLDLFVISTVVHVLIGARGALRRRNLDLVRANDDLATREEEITRQNEELQSQTEELERQSEELRVANDELARRERTLEMLLDLSRSLSVGQKEDDAVERICETLGTLLHGPNAATAILLNDDDKHVRVRCHFGFGSEGIRAKRIPRERAFSSLVLAQGRTGYLEDIALRPDLEIPQPIAGEPMVAALATPLLVRGKSIGTLEIYGTKRTTWTEEQIALAESLAAQTSVTLENSRLFNEIEHGRRRLTTILESLPIGLAIANADLTDIRYNPAGAAMMGVPADANIVDQLTRSIWVPSEDGKPIARERYPIARAITGERVHPHEVDVVLATGRKITVLSSSSPFHDADGKIIGAVSSFVDITQLKQLQRELETRRREAEEANIRKTRFLAAASHDIRTPANAISLLAELLKRTADSPSMAAEIPQLADELRQSATSLVNLVSNVLDVTRFDTDKLNLHETEFPIALLLEEEARQLIPLAQAKHLALEVQPAGEPIWIRADRIKLGRVIGNLLGNSIKFTDQGGIRVTVERDSAGAVCIAVKDTGIGIGPEHLSHIFDEFWQLSDPERSKGSGLGLSICKRLVEAMGGQISVQSSIGAGSTFAIMLPASAVVVRPNGDGSSGARR